MHTFFREVLNDIRSGKNLDVYVAILINAIFAVLSLLGIISLQILGAIMLTSLSWLSLNALSERRESTTQTVKIIESIQEAKSQVRSSDFFTENYVSNSEEFKEKFHSAYELYVIGQGQARMVIAYGGFIRRILSNGGKVKFILSDPDGVGTEMAIKRSSARQSVERGRQTHWSTIERLATNIMSPECKGEITIKFVDLLLPYTMYGFDVYDSNKAKIYVWMTPFQEPSERRPGFALSALQDPYWFSFFCSQFESLWNWDEAKQFDLHKVLNKDVPKNT